MLFALVASGLWIVNSLYSIGYMRANGEPRQTIFYVCFAGAIAATMGIALAGNLFTLFLFYETLTLVTYPLVTHSRDAEAQARRPALSADAARRLDRCCSCRRSPGPASPPARSTSTPAASSPASSAPAAHGHPAGAVCLRHRQGRGHADAFLAAGGDGRADAGVGAAARRRRGEGRRLLHRQGRRLRLRHRDAARRPGQGTGWSTSPASRSSPPRWWRCARTISSAGSPIRRSASSPTSSSALSLLNAARHHRRHASTSPRTRFARSRCSSPPARSTPRPHIDDVSEMDGIGRRMPWTMGAFAVGALSMIGLPPTAGFLGKWFMLLGAAGTAAVVRGRRHRHLDAAQRRLFPADRLSRLPRGRTARRAKVSEAPWPMVVALVITATLTILLFFFPAVPWELGQKLVEMGGPNG